MGQAGKGVNDENFDYAFLWRVVLRREEVRRMKPGAAGGVAEGERGGTREAEMDLKEKVQQLKREAENEMDDALFGREDVEGFRHWREQRDALQQILEDVLLEDVPA